MAAADSWATDAHKTLNVPYDSGLAIVADAAAMRASLGMHADYLIHDAAGEPFDKTPEISRRARGVPVWALLRALGRSGVAAMVDRLVGHAQAFARGIEQIPGATVLNDVVFTQVCVAFEDDARTDDVVRRVLADGEAWMSGSRWHGRSVLRIAVSNWSTTEQDVERSLAAVRRAAEAAPPTEAPAGVSGAGRQQ
jgi:glutamate/tyrosine decarboxylase-like PLP-dependent enzyme